MLLALDLKECLRAPHPCVFHMCVEEHICVLEEAFRRGKPSLKGVIKPMWGWCAVFCGPSLEIQAASAVFSAFLSKLWTRA